MTTKNVSSTSSEVDQMASDWPMIQALMHGTGAMRKARKSFLPQWPNEADSIYKNRLESSVLHPVFSKTVAVMAARPFVQDMKIDPKLPDALSILDEDSDRFNTGLQEFFADRFKEVLSFGLTGVLVDYTVGGGRTIAEEKAMGSRPYFCTYPCQSIIGWKQKNGELLQIRLMESVVEDEDEFNTQSVKQVRVLEPGKWFTYRMNDKKEWIIHEEGITSLDFVPFVFFYGVKSAFGVGVSPLLDLAYQNVEHWQSCSDQQNILHFARTPILFSSGFKPEAITAGGGSMVVADETGANLKWVEHSGAAINSGRESIKDLEDRMNQSGAELLVKRSGSTTATQVISENEANKSLLQNVVEEFEDGVELCLHYASKWVGAKYSAEVDIYKDFSVDADDQDLEWIFKALEIGILTKDNVKFELSRRGVIDPEMN